MPHPILLCPVRDCRRALIRDGRRLVCVSGHSFDTARSGYSNLLQPQDRRSNAPGDTAAAVAARRRLHDLGVTASLRDSISEWMQFSEMESVLDAGCGDGFYLGTMATAAGFTACGIDISTPAVDAAARRYPGCEWIVANADRFIPYTDSSFSAILSITARRNAPEFRRTLRLDGRLLLAVPSPRDLIEIRGIGKDRTRGAIEELASHFTLTHSHRIETHADLDAQGVEDLLQAIYRPMQSQPVENMSITFGLDLMLFRPRNYSAAMND